MTKTTGLSLSDMEARLAAEPAEEFEPILPDGEGSGIILLVKSDACPSVSRGLAALMNERRRKDEFNAAKAQRSRAGEVYTKFEDDVTFTRRAAAVRLAGWKGLDEEFSEANAIRLFAVCPSFAGQVIQKAGELTSFTPAS